MEEVVNERLSNSKINDMKHWSGLLIMAIVLLLHLRITKTT
jgi:hypothetical protein